MITEKHIKMAANLIKMRDTCRTFYKEGWEAKQAEWKPIIQACMKKHNCSDIEAGLTMANQIPGEEFSIMVIFGTIMEMQES